ncbi:PIK3R4 [Bugula neritina]|uniref:PIK3R4 n=1 Tax=Bugula neritina TaxID=10212 RepID=A0A7J7K8F8_BUGNE|nr:PIK3R4 [Bugula neritina]
MGNQIATAKAPNEILPVERYFPLLPATIFEKSLGSTRFLKVAKAKNTSEQQQVVKVFVIQDPSFSLKHYAHEADSAVFIYHRQTGSHDQLSTVSVQPGDGQSSLPGPSVYKYNLYDRISTKPFFTPIEKKWIAFQLLSALSQCHSQNICHGDIKSENVLITSWNWVLLTDFAHFKPAHLPENNPSDYNYFFDTSRRRTCYIAPERFQLSLSRGSEVNLFEPLTGGDGSAAHSLTHAMDIFSVGCVLIELFSEGKVPFNLSQLLSYRNGAYSLWKILDTISDRHIKELLQSMTQKNPSHRLSSEEYLMQQKGKGFPVYFYTFLKSHIQSYGSLSVYPDERISKLRKELPTIIKNTGVTKGQDGHYEPLVIILEILTSAIRELKFCEGKLNSLSLLLELTEYLPTDITLERVIPYMMYLLEDSIPKVNAEAIRVVTTTLSRISFVPRGEANLFPDYIFQSLDNLANPNNLVKVALAENIAVLAETALRFLNLSQASLDIQHNPIDYEAELRTLQGLIQVKVVALLSDSDNSVKRAMMHFSIAKLAIIFGKQKASDIILSHMITFLNDKQDWQLRAEFFRCVVGVASYIGWQSTTVLKPLLEQGLNDTEEFVIRESLQALNSLLSVQLIEKHLVIKLLEQICPLLCHPNHWIRYGVVACVTTIANIWSVADVHCNISPIIRPYLTQQAQQVNRLDVLLHCLHDPVPRPVLDFLIKSSHLNKYFNSLEDRRLQRNIAKVGQLPSYTPQEDVVNQMSKKLFSFGLSEEFEDRLLRMKDFIIKLNIQHKVGGPTASAISRYDLLHQPLASAPLTNRSEETMFINCTVTTPTSVEKESLPHVLSV